VSTYSELNKYVLSIGSTSLASSQTTRGWTARFALNQAIIKRHQNFLGSQSIEPLTHLRGVKLSHDSTNRLTLLRLPLEVGAYPLRNEAETVTKRKTPLAVCEIQAT
jgi:hypothetical protein